MLCWLKFRQKLKMASSEDAAAIATSTLASDATALAPDNQLVDATTGRVAELSLVDTSSSAAAAAEAVVTEPTSVPATGSTSIKTRQLDTGFGKVTVHIQGTSSLSLYPSMYKLALALDWVADHASLFDVFAFELLSFHFTSFNLLTLFVCFLLAFLFFFSSLGKARVC